MGESYRHLTQYLQRLQNRYQVQICIKDFCGFIPINKELDEALEGRLEVVLFLFHEWEPMVPDAPAEPLPAPAAAASAPAVSHGTHAFPDDAAWPVSGGGPSDTARELIAQDGKRIQGRFDQTAPIYYRSQQLDEPTWRRRRLSIDFR